MATTKKRDAAEGSALWAAAQRALVKVVCYSPVVPAAWVNVASDQPAFMMAGNIGVVLGAATFLEACVHTKKGRGVRLLYAASFLVCLLCSLLNGLQNGSHNSAAHADNRQGEINLSVRLQAQLKDLDEQISELERTRASKVKIVGEASPDEIGATIEAEKSANASKWKATDGCDPLKTTLSKDFCTKVNDLKAKQAAAVARDALDKRIEKARADRKDLNGKIDAAGAPPASADEFVGSVENLFRMLGYAMTAEQKQAARPFKDFIWAAAVEIFGAVGPVALGMLFAAGGSSGETKIEASAPEKPASAPRLRARDDVSNRGDVLPKTGAQLVETETSPSKMLETPPQTSPTDPVAAFVAAKLEYCEGETLLPGAVFAAWEEWCRAKGISAGKQTGFGISLKKALAHWNSWEKKGNKTYYRNVRIRELPSLRLAVINS